MIIILFYFIICKKFQLKDINTMYKTFKKFRSFPVNYWDKFVKKKVRQKYSETYDFDSISNLLGMEKTSFSAQEEESGSGIIHL